MNRPASAPFSICVYCGSRPGVRAAYTEAARALGRTIGANGWQLVYGGGAVGLMGEVADATLAAGGRVVGVIPDSLMKREVGHRALHELHVVPTMHLRKQMMAERADAFVALPGGIGTLEELYEVWTWRQLGYHDQPIGLLNVAVEVAGHVAQPIGLLNVAGYFDGLLAFMQHTVDEGFLGEQQQRMVQVGDEPAALLQRLAALARRGSAPDDYSRV